MADDLRLFQQEFGPPRGLVLSLRSPDAETTEHLARLLAGSRSPR